MPRHLSVNDKYTPAGELKFFIKRKNDIICCGTLVKCCPYTDFNDFLIIFLLVIFFINCFGLVLTAAYREGIFKAFCG